MFWEKEKEDTLIWIEEMFLSNKDAYDYDVCFIWLFDITGCLKTAPTTKVE